MKRAHRFRRSAVLALTLVAALAAGCERAARSPSGDDDVVGDDDDDGATPTPTPFGELCNDALPEGAAVYHVAPDGDDDFGDGSASDPWATITVAVESVPDGSVVLVEPGTYYGRAELDGAFASGILVRSRVPYQARLRHDRTVVTSHSGEGITLEGFDIAHTGDATGDLVVQIADPGVRRITIRNNVLHDSYLNDILKVNNGAADVLVEGNIFYNQEGHDEHIDVNSVTGVTVRGNVFFNDFDGSGRTNANDTGSFVVVKDSNDDVDGVLGASDISIERNVFLNWEGGESSFFVLVGEDGKDYHEAFDVTVENNLLVGNAANPIHGAFGAFGARDVVFRHNTVVGDLPGRAYGIVLYQIGGNPPNDGIALYGNVFADPTGTMFDFSDTPAYETEEFDLTGNLYWNGGDEMPYGAADLLNPDDDPQGLVADPRLPDPSQPPLPRWDPERGRFTDGSATTCEAFARLVDLHAKPLADSPVVDAGDNALAPAVDILGRSRSGAPDRGAYER